LVNIMLVIRLFRVGKKNQPSFKIVVTDKRKPPRAGRFAEEVGFYNPKTKEKVLKAERIKYWLSVGAKSSDTVHNLLVSEKIIEGKKNPIYIKKTKKEEVPAAEAPTEAKAEGVKEEKPTPAPAEALADKEEKPKEETPKEEKEKPAEQKTTEEKKEEKPSEVAEEKPKTEPVNEKTAE